MVPVTPELRRLREEKDLKFEASLVTKRDHVKTNHGRDPKPNRG